jgi:ParB family transcriptional regulator, chromosome partitioning protein
MMSKKTLGRGLSSLIPNSREKRDDFAESSKPVSQKNFEGISHVPVTRIKPNPYQPRRSFNDEALTELIDSIKERGILLPLIVSEEKPGEYQLIAGERRFRAAKTLGLETVPVMVKNIGDGDKLEVALIENIQRQNLNPMDESLAYFKLREEFNFTQEEIAKKVGKKRSTIANSLRLLTLPQDMKDAVAAGKITQGHAKVLLGIADPILQEKTFKKLMRQYISVNETNESVQKSSKKTKLPDAELDSWQNDLQSALATKVRISKRGKQGKIAIEFYSMEELKNIISRIINGDS